MASSLVFQVKGTTGLDTLAMWLLPQKMVAKRFAKKLLRSIWKDCDPKFSNLVVELPTGSFKLIDLNGNVEPCRKTGGVA